MAKKTAKPIWGDKTNGIYDKNGKYQLKVRIVNHNRIKPLFAKQKSIKANSLDEAIKGWKQFKKEVQKLYDEEEVRLTTRQEIVNEQYLNENADDDLKQLTFYELVYYNSINERGLIWDNYPLNGDKSYSSNSIANHKSQLKLICANEYADFHSKRVIDIDTKDVQELFSKIKNRGVSVATMQKYRGSLNIAFKALETTIPLRKAGTNPMPNIKVGSPPKKKENKTSLNVKTEYGPVKKLLFKQLYESDEISSREALFFLFALISAMRRSEIVALTWEDIDFENKIIHINGTLTKNAITYEIEFKSETKSGNQRDTIMSSELVEGLKYFKEKYGNDTLWRDTNGKAHNLIFNYDEGRAYTPENFTRAWGELRNKLKADGIIQNQTTLHDLRATAITYLLLIKKIDVEVVAKIVGHEDISITLNVYANTPKELVYEAAIDY
ncbi:tyrosine-type recombinase/integrase [Enterococcus sp. HY326]|uniref:tyrosine-type recombinase/integrase n=1 Tax=Enterococcus sp. HY326 TaxID=2971265 RepID=UPI00223EF4A8|nr:site-specific integrase [Enterococcus sp. HY326]